jgi:hypothetical protein
VARALVKQPAQRFRSAADMLVALDAAALAEQEAEAAAAEASVADEPQPPPDDSLLLLARDLMPARADAAADAPMIPLNVDRTVPALPWPSRIAHQVRRVSAPAVALARKGVASVRALDRRIQLALAAIAAVLVIVLIVVAASGGDDANGPVAASPSASPAQLTAKRDAALPRANDLLAHNQPLQAAELLASEIGMGTPANEPLRETLRGLLAAGHPRAGVLALDVAARMSPVPAALVGDAASTAANADVRHRAVKIAEERGFAVRIDRVSSWSLDLQQATACDQQRALIAKLVGTRDPRAAPALRSARKVACVAREADAGLASLESTK